MIPSSFNKPINRKQLGTIEWFDFEYSHEDKSQDWFWIVGAITAGGILLSIIFKNFLLALILLIGIGTVMALANRKPELIHFVISAQGIRIKNNLYPYGEISSFSLKDDTEPYKLMIESNRLIFPNLIVPLGDIDPDQIRDYLDNFLLETPFEESILDKISEQLGF